MILKKINSAFQDFFELSEKYDVVESLRFSSNEVDSSMFVVTTRNGVVFGQWVGILN